MNATKLIEKTERKVNALKALREMLPPGTTVYCIVRHVARSGMSRRIDLYVMRDGAPRWISGYAAQVMDRRLGKQDDGIVIGGCGMDMGFALVAELSRELYPDGFECVNTKAEPRKCPSNDHSNRVETKFHKSGDYALIHKWM